MRIYLDLCCLKRPFDDPSQLRVRLEGEAILALLAVEGFEFLRASAHHLENDQDPFPLRAARVRNWLDTLSLEDLPNAPLVARTEELMGLGLKGFDALHLASAELGGADVFVTCDDRLLSACRRLSATLGVRVVSPIEHASEPLS